jgi:FkbM family methyltransferase
MYSQSLEEKYILEYFGDYVGTFCSLGESDGETYSNVRALALKGWRGILVEPVPKAFEKMKELYKGYRGFYLKNYAITDFNGTKIFNVNKKGVVNGDCGLLGTFHQSEMERFKRLTDYEQIPVRCHHWKTAINGWRIKEFDMISIDIEGDELNVLPDINLSKTRAVCIEWNSKPELKAEYDKYLEGFKVIYTSAENLIYAR